MKMTKSAIALFLCFVVPNSFAGATGTFFKCEGSSSNRFVVEKGILKCNLRGKITASSTLKIPFVKEITLKSNIHTRVTKKTILDLVQPGKNENEMVAQLPEQRFNGTVVLEADGEKLPFSVSLAPKYTFTGPHLCSPDLKVTEVLLGITDFRVEIDNWSSVASNTVVFVLNKSSDVKEQAQKLTQDSLADIQKFLDC